MGAILDAKVPGKCSPWWGSHFPVTTACGRGEPSWICRESGNQQEETPPVSNRLPEQVYTVSVEGTSCILWVGSAHNSLGGW